MGIALMDVSMLRMQFVETSLPISTPAKAVQVLAASTASGRVIPGRGLPSVQSAYFGREEAGALASIMACARGVAAEAVESASAVTVTLRAAGAPPDRDGGPGDGVNPYLHVDQPSSVVPQHTHAMSTALHPSPSAGYYALAAGSEQSEYENKSVPSRRLLPRGYLMIPCSLPSTATGDQARHRQHSILLPVRTCRPDLLGL